MLDPRPTTPAAALERWPLVVLDVSDLDPTAASQVVNETLLAAIAREEAFAAVVCMPSVSERPRRIRGAPERVRMLKQFRPGLKRYCAGLAFVLSVEAQVANAKAIRAGATLWGCPTHTTDELLAAEEWARGQIG